MKDEDIGGLPTTVSEPRGQVTAQGPLQDSARYTLAETPFARGGMGEIWLADDLEMGRQVAVKSLRPELIGSPSTRARFRRETEVLATLAHPGICPIHDKQLNAPVPSYTMKRIRGQTLETVISDGAELYRLLETLVAICRTLEYAHSRGLIHRDLKPENVIVGEFGEVYVMDWGLATRIGVEELEAPEAGHAPLGPGLSVEGSVIGTPNYMAPEQARGERNAQDERTDVYGAGAILYAMLTGQPPVSGTTMTEAIEQSAAGEILQPSIRVSEREVPWELEQVAMRALATDPAERYPRIAALREALEDFLAGRMLSGVRYAPWQLLGRWAWRMRAPLAVGLLLLTVVGGMRWQQRAQRRARLQADLQAAERLGSEQRGLAPTLEQLELALRQRAEQEADGEALPQVVASARWEDPLERLLRAAAAFERALELAGPRPDLRTARREVGRALALAALLAEDYTLARQAMRDLERFGDATAAEAGVRRVNDERDRRSTRQRERLKAMVAALRAGAARSDRFRGWSLEDHVVEALRFGPQVLLAVLVPALDDLALRVRGGKLEPSSDEGARLLARFCCRLLGRLRDRRAVDALGRWLDALQPRDSELIATCGIALCTTAHPAAVPIMRRLCERIDIATGPYLALQRYLPRLDLDASTAQPGDAEGWIARGTWTASCGRFAEADEAFRKALELNPELAAAHHGRGVVALRQKRWKQAAQHFDEAIAREATPTAYLNRALTRFRLGRFVEAERDCGLGLALDPRSSAASALYGLRSRVRVQRGTAKQALADLDQAIKLEPGSARRHAQRSNVHFRLGQLSLAEADARRAIQLDDGSPDGHLRLGHVAFVRKQYATSLRCCNAAIERDADHYAAHLLRGWTRLKMRAHVVAVTDLRRALTLCDRHDKAGRGQTMLLLGQALAGAGAAKEGLELLRRVPALLPSQAAEAHFQQALIYKAAGDKAATMAALDRALTADPRHLLALMQRGVQRYAARRWKDARDDFRRALAVDPSRWRAWLGIAYAFESEGRKADALAATRSGLKVAPNQALLIALERKLTAR